MNILSIEDQYWDLMIDIAANTKHKLSILSLSLSLAAYINLKILSQHEVSCRPLTRS